MRLPALAAACLTLTACASLPPPASVVATVPIPTFRDDGVVTVNVTGRLERRGSCLLLASERPTRVIRYLVAWPEGTRFDGRHVAAIAWRPEGPVTLALGRKVTLEGDALDWSPHLAATYPQLDAWRRACSYPIVFASGVRRRPDF